MGESACLIRSFSHPSDTSREAKEGDPIRALGESISFGRFMSESLAWEKWSSFPHNRRLEEVEKISRPGSVAQKKAYFEAHYKRIAANKAAALLEQAGASPNNVPEPEIMEEIHNKSSMDSESAKSNSHVAVDEPHGKEAPNTRLVFSVDANGCNPNAERNEIEAPNTEQVFPVDANECNRNFERNELENAKVEGAEPVIDESVLVENPNQVEFPNQCGNIMKHNKLMATQEEKIPIKEATDQEILASASKKKPANSSSKSSTYSRASKLSSSPAKLTTPVHPKKEANGTPNSKKSARDSLDKKRSTLKSLHMSINFASRAGETSKPTSPILQRIRNSRILTTSIKMSKDSSTPLQTPTRASVNGVSKHHLVTPRSENRRTKTLLDPSNSGSRTVDGKWHSLSMDRSKSSSSCGSKAWSPTISSSFSFRSEERAAKRKEFFQKLEEKINAKEAEKMQLQTKSKEKAEHDLKKLRQSMGFKAKPVADLYRESESPSNHKKKIPLTRPRSPKLGRKPTLSTVQDTSSRPPRRPSVKTDGSKRIIEKNNRTPTRSITSPPNKNTHENASPNIQFRVTK